MNDLVWKCEMKVWKCESVKYSLGKSLCQTDVVRRFGLDLKDIKTRRINSSQPLGLCMSL